MRASKLLIAVGALLYAGCVVEPATLEGRSCNDDRQCLPGWFCNDQGTCVASGQCGAEICDGLDNDCDGETDEGLAVVDLWPDRDGDGSGDADAVPTRGCRPPIGFATEGGDCDDEDATRRPGVIDRYGDDIDQDCDGQDGVDEDGDGHAAMFSGGDDCDDGSTLCILDCTDLDEDGIPDCRDPCVDFDGDGFGETHAGVTSTCLGSDCNDAEATCTTVCVDLDQDLVHDCADPCHDADGDGYGAADTDTSRCPNPNQDDCDDSPGNDSDPDGDNVCNRLDNCWQVHNPLQRDSDHDCGAPTYDADPACGDACDTCNDGDRDDYGWTANGITSSCLGEDCDDTKADVYPGAPEHCNGEDDDCDGEIDEDTWSEDADLDGVCDLYDVCRTVFDPDQADFDQSCAGAPWTDDPACGDACADADGDLVVDADDLCPSVNDDQSNVDAGAAPLYENDFSDPETLAHWSSNDLTSWEITSGYLRQITDDPFKTLINDTVTLPASYRLTLRIRPHDNDEFGFYLGYADLDNHDVVTIALNNTNDGSAVDYRLIRRRAGVSTQVYHWRPPATERLLRDNWNPLQIVVTPTRWILRFDHDSNGSHSVVGSAPGAPPAGNRFGFLADDTNDLRIDDVQIIPLVPNDRVGDACDVCPDDADPLQSDCDGDGIGDVCSGQPDSDQDGVGDLCDVCRNAPDPLQSVSGPECSAPPYGADPECGDACRDADGDGITDSSDNCPAVSNPYQADREGAPTTVNGLTTGHPPEWLFAGPWDASGANDTSSALPGLLGPAPVEGRAVYGRRWFAASSANGQYDWITLFSEWTSRRSSLDNIQAHAAVWFHLPADDDLQIGLGSDDSPSLWIDGRPVLQRAVVRGTFTDSDVLTMRLDAGWHLLMLRVSNGGGGWGHELRFRNSDGSGRPLATSITPPFGDGVGDACDPCPDHWDDACFP